MLLGIWMSIRLEVKVGEAANLHEIKRYRSLNLFLFYFFDW